MATPFTELITANAQEWLVSVQLSTRATLNDEEVIDYEPVLGYFHRAMKKIVENEGLYNLFFI